MSDTDLRSALSLVDAIEKSHNDYVDSLHEQIAELKVTVADLEEQLRLVSNWPNQVGREWS